MKTKHFACQSYVKYRPQCLQIQFLIQVSGNFMKSIIIRVTPQMNRGTSKWQNRDFFKSSDSKFCSHSMTQWGCLSSSSLSPNTFCLLFVPATVAPLLCQKYLLNEYISKTFPKALAMVEYSVKFVFSDSFPLECWSIWKWKMETDLFLGDISLLWTYFISNMSPKCKQYQMLRTLKMRHILMVYILCDLLFTITVQLALLFPRQGNTVFLCK